MRVTQTISIGRLSINSMSNSSIVQIGASGTMRSRNKSINEYVTPAQAEQQIEGQVTSAVQPILNQEGLPLDPPTPAQGAAGAGGTSASGGNRKRNKKNRT